jgi:hypothetical protein
MWNKLGPMADPTPATVKNKGAAERRAQKREEAVMSETRTHRRMEHKARRHQTERDDEGEEEEDMEGLMDAVARAISQAERNARTSQEAETAPCDARINVLGNDERKEAIIEDPGNYLQEATEQATGVDPRAKANRRRRSGKALAEEEEATTPDAVQQQQATPATIRYQGRT